MNTRKDKKSIKQRKDERNVLFNLTEEKEENEDELSSLEDELSSLEDGSSS